MNLVSQPIIGGGGSSNGTERKISMFNDNLFEKMKIKEEEARMPEENGKGKEDKDKSVVKEVMRDSVKEILKDSFRGVNKRSKLLAKHQECLVILS